LPFFKSVIDIRLIANRLQPGLKRCLRSLLEEFLANLVTHELFSHVFGASVIDNIRFFDDAVSREDIESAARQAHIYDEVMKLFKEVRRLRLKGHHDVQ